MTTVVSATQQCRLCEATPDNNETWPASDLCPTCQLWKQALTSEAAECPLISLICNPNADASTVTLSLRISLDNIGLVDAPTIDTRGITITQTAADAELALVDPVTYTRRHIIPAVQTLLAGAVATLNTRLAAECRALDRGGAHRA